MLASVSTVPLEIQETVVTQTYPLLPYLFFDEGQADLPSRYRTSGTVAGFNEQELPHSTLEIYYDILVILGSRMKASGSALTITGTSDGRELASATERRALARQRAESVQQAIQQLWGIPDDQFVIRTVDRPALRSNEDYNEGIEENRRVELSSNDASLLGPVVHSRFNEYVATQPKHDFSVAVTHPELATAWDLGVQHGTERFATRQGASAPPSRISFALDQKTTEQLGPVIDAVDSLDGVLTIQQREQEPFTTTTRFPIVKTTSTFEVSRLSLIVFDYDRSEISSTNRAMMEDVISKAVRDGSRATIIGSTDRLGELDHNLELSQDRASSVERFARSIAPTLNIDDVKGIGPSQLLYDNSRPEGRFYCRTVSLTITTPLR